MTIFDELKAIGKTLQEVGKIEQYQQILEAQKKLSKMQKEIQTLEKDNVDLKKKLNIKESIISDNNAYWINKENKKDGPFCSRCWDVDQLLVRLQPCGNPAYYKCPNCKADAVKVKSGPDPAQRIQFRHERYF